MKKYLVCLLVTCLGYQLNAQTPMNLDSLLGLLPVAPQDTNAVELYIQIGQQYETNQPQIANSIIRRPEN